MLYLTKKEIIERYKELCSYDYDSFDKKDLNSKIEEFAAINAEYQKVQYAGDVYRAMGNTEEDHISKFASLILLKDKLLEIIRHLHRNIELEIDKIKKLN